VCTPHKEKSIGNKKVNKIGKLKRLSIEPSETGYEFKTRFLKINDQLETNDKASISIIDYEKY